MSVHSRPLFFHHATSYHTIRQTLLLLVLVLFALLLPSPTQATPTRKQQVIALLIGINLYKHPKEIPTLKYTHNDVNKIYDALTRFGGLTQNNVKKLLNKNANKKNIIDHLRKWLLSRIQQQPIDTKPEDITIIVHFSGHGHSVDGSSYLLPYDADPQSEQSIANSSIDLAIIREALRKLKDKGIPRIILMTDACNSGDALRLKDENNIGNTKSFRFADAWRKQIQDGKRKTLEFALGEGFVTLSSSAQNQLSIESDHLKQGIFSYVIAEGLQGKADYNKDGMVTLAELWTYVTNEVGPLAFKEKNYRQSPVKNGVEGDNIPLSFPGQKQSQLVFHVHPPNVALYINGKYVAYITEVQPFSIERPPGAYKIEIQKHGYQTHTLELELSLGTSLPVHARLQKLETPDKIANPNPPRDDVAPSPRPHPITSPNVRTAEPPPRNAIPSNNDITNTTIPQPAPTRNTPSTNNDSTTTPSPPPTRNDALEEETPRVRTPKPTPPPKRRIAMLDTNTSLTRPTLSTDGKRPFELVLNAGGLTGIGGFASFTWNFIDWLGLCIVLGGQYGLNDLSSGMSLRSVGQGIAAAGLQLSIGNTWRWVLRATPGVGFGAGAGFAFLAGTGFLHRFSSGILLGASFDLQYHALANNPLLSLGAYINVGYNF